MTDYQPGDLYRRGSGETVRLDRVTDDTLAWSRPSTVDWKRRCGLRATGQTARAVASFYLVPVKESADAV